MKKYFLFFTIVNVYFGLEACQKFIDIDPPTDKLVTKSVFSSNASATAAVTSMYSQMYTSSYNMSLACGLLSDELVNDFSNARSLIQFYTNSMTSITITEPWTSAYKIIFQANAALEAFRSNNDISKPVIQQLTGEAKFVRAFWFFYLVNCYGDVPLTTTTDYKVNANMKRSSRSEVFLQILQDLNDAKEMLNADYVDNTDTALTNPRVRIRPTKWAATALLSRVYLYLQKYAEAEEQATLVLNNTDLYGLTDNLNDVFKANSKEAIWQLDVPIPSATNSTYDGSSYILNSTPASGSAVTRTVTVSPKLLSSFDIGDRRKDEWIDTFVTTSPTNAYIYPYKYKMDLSNDIVEYTMVLRLAEQYLIRAEAKVQQNKDIDGAVSDIDAIRKRAGLLEYKGSKEKDSLLAEILHQRQDELFIEWGHRWFDLIRTGKADEVMSVVTPLKGGKWTSDDKLFPLPQSEININFNLVQNPSYY